jgi:hypothetical protein
MKIESNSIRSAVNELKQEANATETAKTKSEVSPDTKNEQLSGQLASNIKSEQSFIAQIRADEMQKTVAQLQTNPKLMDQIATVKVTPSTEAKIKPLLEQLNSLRDQKQGLIAQIQSVTTQIQGAEVAGNYQLAAQGMAQLQSLKSQLAHVDVQIKKIMSEIEEIKTQEQEEQERMKSQEEAHSSIESNLAKTAEKTSEIRSSVLDLLK